MSANVESLFSVREVPWHGLGKIIEEAPSSKDAIIEAGLNWLVTSEPIFVGGNEVKGYRANVRSTDKKILGVVSDKYRIVQNEEAFEFTDALLGEGCVYETAGSLASGKRVWMLAKLEGTKLQGEDFEPYLVFTNSHDGSSSIRVAITPVRVVCQNTLNLALRGAKRQWAAQHIGNIKDKLAEATFTLKNANSYMDALDIEIKDLKDKDLTRFDVKDLIEKLMPMNFDEDAPENVRKANNIIELRDRLMYRYTNAPDLRGTGDTAYRFINAVSDFATHENPKRWTENWQENRMMNTVEGNALIDKAYKLVA